jgi:hypothetical protein
MARALGRSARASARVEPKLEEHKAVLTQRLDTFASGNHQTGPPQILIWFACSRTRTISGKALPMGRESLDCGA